MKKIKLMLLAVVAMAVLALPGAALAHGSDRDHDKLPDRWELRHQFSVHAKSAAADTDRDGLSNGGEYDAGLNPRDTDTDNDGVDDGDEDPDNDGLDNEDEENLGTKVDDVDSDDDGIDGDDSDDSVDSVDDDSVDSVDDDQGEDDDDQGDDDQGDDD
ncbi:MAG: hypothetical protein ACR2KD_00855 [Thermoleophilaceae bacterium]